MTSLEIAYGRLSTVRFSDTGYQSAAAFQHDATSRSIRKLTNTGQGNVMLKAAGQ
jgi:hypothetical protein